MRKATLQERDFIWPPMLMNIVFALSVGWLYADKTQMDAANLPKNPQIPSSCLS